MTTLHDFELKKITGQSLALSTFTGQVVLLVNVASECGYTKQYQGLQEIYTLFKDRGFVVLGVPCNQFGGQEPGTEAQIQAFCESKYSVTFPMTSKIDVKGHNQHPLYAWLTQDSARYPGDVEWNFAKFLFDRQGNVIRRFDAGTKPTDEDVLTAIEVALNN